MKKLIYSFLFVLCSVFALQAESMVVATYNLRNANAGDSTNGNGWGQRYPYIAQLVQFHGFDIFGTQEGKYIFTTGKAPKPNKVFLERNYYIKIKDSDMGSNPMLAPNNPGF